MYYLVFGFLYLLSLLPFRVLYAIGDVFTFFIRDVFKYRKELVLENLRYSFPEKSDQEIEQIARKFYQNFTDNWMETVKLLSMSKATLDKRYKTDYSVCEKAYAEGRALILMAGHFFNWEWANTHISYHQSYPFLGVYMPLTNKVFDKLFVHLRSKFGTVLIRATDIRKELIPWRGRQYAIGLLADQSPGNPMNSYWLPYLHRPAGVVRGPERTARLTNAVVIMGQFKKLKRGYYEVHFEKLTSEPLSEPEGHITRRFIEKLEENVREQPALYLWTHNRWKISWKPEFGHLWIDTTPPPTKD
jgi:KDO2-lipid IV(A) lauroyltransferase